MWKIRISVNKAVYKIQQIMKMEVIHQCVSIMLWLSVGLALSPSLLHKHAMWHWTSPLFNQASRSWNESLWTFCEYHLWICESLPEKDMSHAHEIYLVANKRNWPATLQRNGIHQKAIVQTTEAKRQLDHQAKKKKKRIRKEQLPGSK